LLLQVKGDLGSIASAQSVQLASTEHQMELSAELSEAQKASLVLGQEMRHSSLSLTSHLDNADAVAGRVSSRLDKVNQALSRVEKVSVVLSALSAVVAIPLQMIDQLHLRLFALFSMPAVILFFWKPRKYAYSLMAVYGTWITLQTNDMLTQSSLPRKSYILLGTVQDQHLNML
jgi:hypothetical protein